MDSFGVLVGHVAPAYLTTTALLLQVYKVSAHPLLARTPVPIAQSSDSWAQVVANVSPLMALLGERNAKEYMRTASSWHQLFVLAAAPLGILSITVSAIRLSGPGFLRRLVGRDSERRSEALVELTPLSVSPATSVFTPRAVEISPTYERDRVAFVCAHISQITDVSDAIAGYQDLLRLAAGPRVEDGDKEVVLAIWGSSLGLEEVYQICIHVSKAGDLGLPDITSRTGTASLSYRTTGVSPTQTSSLRRRNVGNIGHWRDLIAACLFVIFMVGIQVLSLEVGTNNRQIFLMGCVGYVGIVLFTFGLLLMIQHEVEIEEERLPALFHDAIWTFSDSRHADHRPMESPKSNSLVIARPRRHSTKEIFKLHILTSFLAFGIGGSYLVYYLSMRVSDWWVPLASLGAIWIGGIYRALVARNFLIATDDSVGTTEHWIGLFRNTVSESLLATLDGAASRAAHDADKGSTSSSHSMKGKERSNTPLGEDMKGQFIVAGAEILPAQTNDSEDLIENKLEAEILETERALKSPNPLPNRTILLIVPAIRTGMRTWSGTEDVMKVGLEMAKLICNKRVMKLQVSERFPPQTTVWLCVVRIRLAVYVPGLVWRSTQDLDLALTKEFDLETVIRHVIKMLHVCMDHEGDVTTHFVDEGAATALSHVLCGPVALPPSEQITGKATLREVLTGLKNNKANENISKFTLEQAVLLPTIILACTYNRWLLGAGVSGDEIQALQAKHVDNLALSGKAFLHTIMSEFDKLGIWDTFMLEEQTQAEKASIAVPRDASSGSYGTHNVRDQLMDHYVQPIGEEARAVNQV